MKKEITADKELVAYCGLYCGACGRYLSGKCPGCKKNEKASWCAPRKCCIEKGYLSCAECEEFSDQNECKKFNNFISKIFKVIFGSNRRACLRRIKEIGYENYAKEMSGKKARTVKE